MLTLNICVWEICHELNFNCLHLMTSLSIKVCELKIVKLNCCDYAKFDLGLLPLCLIIINGMTAEENSAMAISGRCRSHLMAIAVKVTDNANKRLAISSPQLIISPMIDKSSIKGKSLL